MTDINRDGFAPEFFTREDEDGDAEFYEPPRLVTHIDDTAIAVVGALYEELGVKGHVLDLMGSWVSHFKEAPEELTVLGMNYDELMANPQATQRWVKDLNEDPELAFEDDTFDHAVCCVSVDYLIHPFSVFREVARVVKPGGLFVCTFSNEYSMPGYRDPWPQRRRQLSRIRLPRRHRLYRCSVVVSFLSCDARAGISACLVS